MKRKERGKLLTIRDILWLKYKLLEGNSEEVSEMIEDLLLSAVVTAEDVRDFIIEAVNQQGVTEDQKRFVVQSWLDDFAEFILSKKDHLKLKELLALELL